MNHKIYNALQEIDLYDYLKIIKDRLLCKSEIEKINEQRRFNFYSRLIKKGDLCF